MDVTEFDKILASARMPEKTIPLCMRGDLQAEWEKLDAELNAEKPQETATLAGPPPNIELAQRIEALQEEMRESLIVLRLRAMSRDPWFALTAAHPPRPDIISDRMQGFNGSTIWDDLIAETLIEPQLDRERVTLLLNKITPGQLDRLAQEAWDLNRRDVVSVPFSLTASLITRNSGETSKPPSDSGSLTVDGRAGSRRKSPSTNVTKPG